jgi:hypothetical protein
MGLIPYSHLLLLQAVVGVAHILAGLHQVVLVAAEAVVQIGLLAVQAHLDRVMLEVMGRIKITITLLVAVEAQALLV